MYSPAQCPSLSQIPCHFHVPQQETWRERETVSVLSPIPRTEHLLTNALLDEELFTSRTTGSHTI